MPYPNEHAVRINSPDQYKALRRLNNEFGDGIDVIFGIKDDGTTEVQAIRFRADKFSQERARKWISDHPQYSEHVKKFEPATRKDSDVVCVIRFDRSAASKVRRTDEGFMYVDANVTRTGVFNYRLPDGTIRRELRHPNDIFRPDSLETLKLKPVTNNHPDGLLDSATARQHQIGMTGENITHDERYIRATLAITDAQAVHDIENGKRELSCGYRCELIPEQGKFDGMDYDFRQTNVRYNHVAVVERGRAGADVSISLDHMDGMDGEQVDKDDVMDAVLSYEAMQDLPDSDFAYVKTINGRKIRKLPIHDAAHVRNALARFPITDIPADDRKAVLAKIRKRAKDFGIEYAEDSENTNHSQRRDGMPTIKLNGIEYEAAQEVINHVAKLDADLAEQKKALDAVTAERDSVKAKLDEQQKRIDGLGNEIANAVKARLDLERKALTILPAETKFDGMSDKDIQLAVIKARAPEANMDGKSDEYIRARFDSTVELAAEDALAKQRQQSAQRMDGQNADNCDSARARQDMIDRMTGKKKNDGKK